MTYVTTRRGIFLQVNHGVTSWQQGILGKLELDG